MKISELYNDNIIGDQLLKLEDCLVSLRVK